MKAIALLAVAAATGLTACDDGVNQGWLVDRTRVLGARVEAERPLESGQLTGLDEREAQLPERLLVMEVDGGVELLAEQVGDHADPAGAGVGVTLEHVDPLEIAGPFGPALEVGGGGEAGGRRRLDLDVPGAFDGHSPQASNRRSA